MAQIFIDGQEQELDLTQSVTLGDVFTQVAEAVEVSGRIMANASLDGTVLAEEETMSRMKLSADNIGRIDVGTVSAKELAVEALSTMGEYLGRLNAELLRVAGLWRVGNDLEANESFAQCVEGIRWFRRSVDLSRQVLALQFDQIMVDGRSLKSLDEQFDRNVDEMLEAQGDADWILMADLVEYEFNPNLDGWLTAIHQITGEALQ